MIRDFISQADNQNKYFVFWVEENADFFFSDSFYYEIFLIKAENL